jgi:hypothetical protein
MAQSSMVLDNNRLVVMAAVVMMDHHDVVVVVMDHDSGGQCFIRHSETDNTECSQRQG